jgi:hypothetical protein
MLDRPLTVDGAAQALGWPKARVTARVKLLELPERAPQLIGDGVIPLSAVDQLRAIGTVAPKLLDAVVAYLDDGLGQEDRAAIRGGRKAAPPARPLRLRPAAGALQRAGR